MAGGKNTPKATAIITSRYLQELGVYLWDWILEVLGIVGWSRRLVRRMCFLGTFS